MSIGPHACVAVLIHEEMAIYLQWQWEQRMPSWRAEAVGRLPVWAGCRVATDCGHYNCTQNAPVGKYQSAPGSKDWQRMKPRWGAADRNNRISEKLKKCSSRGNIRSGYRLSADTFDTVTPDSSYDIWTHEDDVFIKTMTTDVAGMMFTFTIISGHGFSIRTKCSVQ